MATHVGRMRAAQVVAARARRADLVQLRTLKSQENRIRQLIIERARRQKGGFRGDSGGFLARPVPGGVTSPFGWRRHPIYGYWGLHDGTDFHAPCGTPERAANAGTVISEYWSDVYGHRLYLDLGQVNGKNMTVIYNHLTSYAVGNGARVKRGEAIGYAGTHRLVHRLPPALHRAARRQPGEPDELPVRPSGAAGFPGQPGIPDVIGRSIA